MRKLNRLTMTLVALLSMTTGAWAQTENEVTVTPVTDKTNQWTFTMPANDVELQVEYYAESHLFLSKEALADKDNIVVKNGETTVAFDDNGKSTNTVTEGNTVTATYTGKKVLGMTVKKGGIVLLSAATKDDIGKVVCAAGHLHEAKTAVPDGCTAVGILGQVTETGHGLILALKDAAQQTWNTINGWTSVNTYAGTTLKVLPDADARGTNLTSYTTLGEIPVSNWGVANYGPYSGIFLNLDSNKDYSDVYLYDNNVNAYITGAGGTALSGNYITLDDDGGSYAYDFDDSSYGPTGYSHLKNVRPIIAF